MHNTRHPHRWLAALWCSGALCCADDAEGLAWLCRPDAQGLVINEWLANPTGPDAHREWVELRNDGNDIFCLNRAEWRVHSAAGTQRRSLLHVGCLAPNELLLLGDGTQSSRQSAGGHPVDATYGSVELPNTGATMEVACQQSVLARVRYGDDGRDWPADAPSPMAGRSTARIASPTGGESFCNVVMPPYDGRDMGSPGADNLACALCEDDGVLRPQQVPSSDTLRVQAVYADPPGADRDREWLRVRSHALAPVDLVGLRVEVEVPGRKPRRLSFLGHGCASLAPGDTLHLPVLAAQSASSPALIGPTLPNEGAWYRLWWHERLLSSAWAPAPIGHACVLPAEAAP